MFNKPKESQFKKRTKEKQESDEQVLAKVLKKIVYLTVINCWFTLRTKC